MQRSLAAVQLKVNGSQTLNNNSCAKDDSGENTLRIAYGACADAKGKDVIVLDVTRNFGLADYFMVVSARSDRHAQGIANRAIEELEQAGIIPYSVQGFEEGHWIVIDCIELVMHIFYEPMRKHYDIENLWLNAEPIKQDRLMES